MAKKVKIGLIQAKIEQLDHKAALKKLKAFIDHYELEKCDLIILPELWSSGTVKPGQKISKSENQLLLKGLIDISSRLGVSIISPMAELVEKASQSRLYNSSFIITPQGVAGAYRKINLFAPMQEDTVFAKGSEVTTFDIPTRWGFITIAPFICFDLRFPELARKATFEGADLLVYSALWPKQRIGHFHSLLKARAIENQCFVAGVNGTGSFENVEFGSGSSIFSPTGKIEANIESGESAISCLIDLEELEQARTLFCSAKPPSAWPPLPESKIVDLDALAKISKKRKAAGQKLVFTNGCFDILHAGHVDYLNKARKCGDFLVVGLNSDSSVRSIKGPSRPINSQDHRAKVLASLGCVDYVVIFDDPDPASLIETLIPNILVKGADWKEEEIVGRDTVIAYGGEIVRIPFQYDLSTTKIIRKAAKKSNF